MKWGVVFFVTPFFFYISRNCIFILFSSHYPPEMGDFQWCCEVKRKQTKVLVLDIFLASPSTIDMHSQLAAFRTQRSRKNISWSPLGATIFLTTLKDTLEKSDRDPDPRVLFQEMFLQGYLNFHEPLIARNFVGQSVILLLVEKEPHD